ncbi:MAG: flagellar basal-body rod protein FlgF [Desulfobulbus sp.]|nr:flagellar basal-body rod protein FlgF [Desulfobulbus sp.]
MGSGKYSALSGAVSREQAINNIAANLANVNTTGFKKDRLSFAAILQSTQQTEKATGINHTRVQTTETDFSQGGLRTTGRPMDVAIDGAGFFKIMKDNTTLYTRSGSFVLDSNGLVKTADGYTVIGNDDAPLQLDTTTGKDIAIGESGEIAVNGTLSGNRLVVFNVPDPKALVKLNGNLYRLDTGEGQPMQEYRVVQGCLETSNVNMMEEMTSMIAAQRLFEAHTKAIESFAKISEKQDELGSL